MKSMFCYWLQPASSFCKTKYQIKLTIQLFHCTTSERRLNRLRSMVRDRNGTVWTVEH